ncbi:MAG: hypothetical protein QM535_15890 [Limnohabitans sp.]|nr:hypothetical protein [Limnohabitans sp.]
MWLKKIRIRVGRWELVLRQAQQPMGVGRWKMGVGSPKPET